MTIQNRNHTVDLLRGIAALCMVLGHSFIVHPVDISRVPWCAATRDLIYTFHMELFFLLSGWVFHCGSYPAFLKKKAVRILVPYLCFGSVSMILHIFGGSLVNGTTSIADGLHKFLLLGGSYWFFYTLFIIFAVYPLLSRLLNTPRKKLACIILVLLLNHLIVWPRLFTLDTVMRYLPYFIFGNYLRDRGWGAQPLSQQQKILLLSGGFAVFSAISMLIRSGMIGPDAGWRFLRSVSFCAMLHVLCSFLNPSGLLGRMLETVSRYSLQLYLFNGYCLTAIRILLCSILHIESPLIIVSGICIGTIVITLFACKVILPRSKFLRLLCGL